MTKLHELLAVEQNLRKQAEATRHDLQNTFEKKRTHFSEVVQTFKPNTEGAPEVVEARLEIQTTVKKELAWISEKIGKAIDAAYQIDMANTFAKADVVLEDGTTLLTGLPATALLQLEKRIAEVHELVRLIPTLDPSKGFTPDADRGDGIFKARDIEKARTEKQFRFVVMVPATDKHAAQVKELMEDKPVGKIVQQEWSSLITVAEKGEMIDRVEALLRAVKQARSRANEVQVDVKNQVIAEKILGYIFKA